MSWHDAEYVDPPKDGTIFLGFAYDEQSPSRASFGEFVWIKAENINKGFWAGTIHHPIILAWRSLSDFPHELTLKIDNIINAAKKRK